MKKITTLFTALLLCILVNSMQAQQPFITTWVTQDSTIGITINNDYTYNYNVILTNLTNPGQGDSTVNNCTTAILFYELNPGDIYQMEITGTFPHLRSHDFLNNDSKLRSIEQWGDISWFSMEDAFKGCINMVYNAVDTPNLSDVISTRGMFRGCQSFNGNIESWDVSNIMDMNFMFMGCSNFNQPLNGWDVSNVSEMWGMFLHCTNFNQPLNNWDVSNVGMMYEMFKNASSFNQNINNWDVGSVINMKFMFDGASSFNQPLNNWDVSNATSMTAMFRNTFFNQPLNNWDVSNVKLMGLMFYNNPDFNQPLNSWDVSSVERMPYMFYNASDFNQALNNWNTSKVNALDHIFAYARSFDQSLATWDLNSASDGTGMLDSCGMSLANYDSTLIAWAQSSNHSQFTLGAKGLEYCAGENARDELIWLNNWTFIGDSKECGTITGTEEVEAASGFQVWPNPSSGELHFQLDGPAMQQMAQVQLYSLQGQLLRSWQGIPASLQTEVSQSFSQLTPGMYILQVQTKEAKYQEKVVKW